MAAHFVKTYDGFLSPLAHHVADWAIPRIPARVTANQVTILGFVCLLVTGLSLYLGGRQRAWLLVAALGLFAHWLTDNLDGALAHVRGSGTQRGFFLDMFLDNVGGIAVTIGLATASYTVPALMVAFYGLFLLQTIMIQFWIILRQRFAMGRFGPDEMKLGLMLLALLTFAHPGSVVHLAGHGLGWFDLAALIFVPLSALAIAVSAIQLYRALDASA